MNTVSMNQILLSALELLIQRPGGVAAAALLAVVLSLLGLGFLCWVLTSGPRSRRLTDLVTACRRRR